MDIVSYETAKALHAAGFPQPETVEAGFLYFEGRRDPIPVVCCTFVPQSLAYYAPTADDILRHLPDYALVYSDVYPPAGFSAYDTMQDGEKDVHTGENAAELLAKRWLRLRGIIL